MTNLRSILIVSGLLLFVTWFARAIDVEDLKPGLIATYRDKVAEPVTMTRIEPRVAVAWRGTEAAHPRLGVGETEVRWEGFLNVLRAGNYRFGATLRGKVSFTVGGKEVFAADSNAVAEKLGAESRLESGPQPIVVTFTRPAGDARLDLQWQGPNFPLEPIPHDFLFHQPDKPPASLARDEMMEKGRFLVEESSCVRCHKPAATDKVMAGLAWRQGPDLSQVGGRVYASWMYHWLTEPHKVRPGAAMPQMFANDDAGRTEAFAVTSYLASLGGPLHDPGPPKLDDKANKQLNQTIDQAKRLFTSTGCIVCHGEDKDDGKTATASGAAIKKNFPLGALGSKEPEGKLASYLLNPLSVDPSGRMPNMLLNPIEATALAKFLTYNRDDGIKRDLPKPPTDDQKLGAFRRVAPNDDTATFQKLADKDQWKDLGRRLVIAKNCTACHTIAPDKKPLPEAHSRADFGALKAEKSHSSGCLADDGGKRGQTPVFTLTDGDRKAVRAFLQEGTKGVGSSAPAQAARVALHRFNCLACHSRNGKGGLSPELTEELRRFEKVENAEALTPPPLTGVGQKLRTPWLKQVLTQSGRARPWMGLRMPQFGDPNVGHLAEGLALLDAQEPEDKIHTVALSPAKIEAGRTLTGKAVFGCASCHDLAGIPNSGTRGPDLALMNQRVRYDWYQRWMNDAQRITPGTRMPTVFPNNTSTYPKLFNGDAHAQSEAMWAYFSLGPTLPLPDGMEPPKGLVLTVQDRPYVLRTFMPEGGSRCIAVGYPGGISTTFDAATCRLVYAWSGNFLDASPVWDGRGGNPAKLLGPKFWTSPPGCAWGLGSQTEPPDFAARAKDPAFGGPLPENKAFHGVKQLHYLGYSLDSGGAPTFRYRLGADEDRGLTVSEKTEPQTKSGVGFGLRRQFTVENTDPGVAWLLIGETSGEPRLLDGQNHKTILLDLKKERQELPVDGRMVVLPQGGRPVVVALKEAPAQTTWMLVKQGASWQLLVQLPRTKGSVNVVMDVWTPFRDDPALLKALIGVN